MFQPVGAGLAERPHDAHLAVLRAPSAPVASGAILTNHCSEISRPHHGYGSASSGRGRSCSPPLFEQAEALERGDDAFARLERASFGEWAGLRRHSASKPMTCMRGRRRRVPISKSVGSWAGATFTAPVPKPISTAVSATMGMPVDHGQDDVGADEIAVARVVRVDGDGGVAQDGARARRRRRRARPRPRRRRG